MTNTRSLALETQTTARLDAVIAALHAAIDELPDIVLGRSGKFPQALSKRYAKPARSLLRAYGLTDLVRAYCATPSADSAFSRDRVRRLVSAIVRHHVSVTALVEALADVATADPAAARLFVADVVAPLQRDLFGLRPVAKVSDLDPHRPAKGTKRLFRSGGPGRLTRDLYREIFGVFPPAHHAYLETQVARAHRNLTRDQTSFALVLTSDWAGTFDELLTTARELRPTAPGDRTWC